MKGRGREEMKRKGRERGEKQKERWREVKESVRALELRDVP